MTSLVFLKKLSRNFGVSRASGLYTWSIVSQVGVVAVVHIRPVGSC